MSISLNVDDLQVTSYATSDDAKLAPDPFCCTGCDSGCGINPTAGGCASGGGETVDFCM